MKTTSKINLSIILFFVLTVLIFVFGVYPIFKDIDKNSQEVLRQKKELIVLEAEITNLKKFKTVYKELEDILSKIQDLFVDLQVPVDFIRFLETTAESCSLNIGISPTSSGKFGSDYWQSLVFQINSKGSFPNFLRFLEKLENSPYLIETQSLNISREGDGVRAVFSIKVFAE